MDVTFYYNKSLNENISLIFDKIKKLKEKLMKTEDAIKKLENKLKKQDSLQSSRVKVIKSKRYWFEKYRWFITSSGHLFIAGRDATTNEILIKRHVESQDLVFHTISPGSPFGLLKHKFPEELEKYKELKLLNQNKEIAKVDVQHFSDFEIQECADFVVSFSRSWKQGINALETFYVFPDQVSKKSPSGEYLKKGSFMIYGKKNQLLGYAGLIYFVVVDLLMVIPEHSLKHYENFIKHLPNDKFVLLMPNTRGLNTGSVIKKISSLFNFNENIIQNSLPVGSHDIKILSKSQIIRICSFS